MKNIFNSKKLAFWNNWQKGDKFLYLIALGFFTLSILFFIFSYHFGIDLLIKWNLVSDTIGINTPLESFQRNLNEYTLEVQSYFVSQHYEAGKLHINTLGAKIYLIFIAFSAALIITAISMVRKIFWYAVGMTFFFAWLAFMKLDTLAVLGYENQSLLIACLILFGGVSFYFHAFKTETKTIIRFLVFLALILGIGTFIITTSTQAHPYIHLTNYGTVLNSVMTIIFIVVVGYDILNGFLSLSIGSQSSPIKGLINFGVISTLYLGNLLLVFLNQIGVISWNLNFFNPFYLFLISAILGIWAHRRRSNLVKHIIDFHSAGALLFIGLAINSVMTFAYAFATTNDPMISVFEDTITYSFLCVGFLFVIYILINFFDPLKKGVNVYEYIFNPQSLGNQSQVLGHYFIRLGAIGIMIYLIGKDHYLPYKHWWGAYHNYVGDVYTINGNVGLAEVNYKRANDYARLNHKSIYTLASLALEKENYAKAESYLKLLDGQNLSEFACINLAYTYEQVGKPFQSIFTLQEGVKRFPKNGILHHNLAYAFQKYNKGSLDSIYHYYHNAEQYLDNPIIAQANMLAFFGENQIKVNTDSLFKTLPQNNAILENNYLALSAALGQENSLELKNKPWINDSIASTEMSCFLYNYSFTRLGTNDTLLKSTIQKFLKNEQSAFPENLNFALACLHYYDNDLLAAKLILDDILVSCTNQLFPYYSNFTGTLFYKRYLNKVSLNYFEKSAQSQRFFVVNSAPSHYAFNVSENSSVEDLEYPLLLISNLDEKSKNTFRELVTIFNNPPVDSVVEHWTDKHKFQYLAYHPESIDDSSKCLKVLRSIKDEQLRAQTCSVLLDKIIETNDRSFAEIVWNEIPKIELYPRILEEINFQYLQLLPLQYKFKELSDRLETIKLSNERKLYYYYQKGIAFEALGDTVNAKIAFEAAVKTQSLFDKAYVRMADYLPKDKSYEFLVEASYLLPKSVPIYKKLAIESLERYMNTYAEVSLQKLATLLSEKEFTKFKITYDLVKEEADKAFNEGL